jgi:hypothetical protein
MFALNIGNAKHAQNGSRWFLAELCKAKKGAKRQGKPALDRAH